MHTFELEIIRFIHEYRTPIFDAFFKFLNYFDRQEFLFVLIPAVWLGRGWKSGLRLFYILVLSAIVNRALKDLFLSPRPFHLDSTVGILQVRGYGFPSGAAQTVIFLSGILISFWKSNWKWLVAFGYILLISFSRIYLGVHFVSDILAGWIVGIGLLAVYTYAFPWIESHMQKCRPSTLFVICQLLPALLFLWKFTPFTISLVGNSMGIGMGLFLNHSKGWILHPSQSKKEFIFRALVGIAGIFLCYFSMTLLPMHHSLILMFARFILLGFCTATGGVLLCRWLFSIKKLRSL